MKIWLGPICKLSDESSFLCACDEEISFIGKISDQENRYLFLRLRQTINDQRSTIGKINDQAKWRFFFSRGIRENF